MRITLLATLCALFTLMADSAFSSSPLVKNRTEQDLRSISAFFRGTISDYQALVFASQNLDAPILEDEPCTFRLTLRRLTTALDPNVNEIKVIIDRGFVGGQLRPSDPWLLKEWGADGNRCVNTHSRLFGPMRGAFSQILYFDSTAQTWVGREPNGSFSIETFLSRFVLRSDGTFKMDFIAKNLISPKNNYSYVRFIIDSSSAGELRNRLYIRPQTFASNPEAILNAEDPCLSLTQCKTIFDKVKSFGFLSEPRRPKLGPLLKRPDGSILLAIDQVQAEEECRARDKSLPTAKQMIESTAVECSAFGQRLCGARIVEGRNVKQAAESAGLTYASVTNPGYVSESFWFRSPRVGDNDYCLWTSSWIDTENGRVRWPQILGTSGEFLTPHGCSRVHRAVRCLD